MRRRATWRPSEAVKAADGNSAEVRDLLWPHVTTLVWLDYPRRVVMGRVIRRSIRRAGAKLELWNGQRLRLVSVG
jgi:hypothetical protein